MLVSILLLSHFDIPILGLAIYIVLGLILSVIYFFIGMLITSVIAALGGANPAQMCLEIGVAVVNGWGWYVGIDPLHPDKLIIHDYIYM